MKNTVKLIASTSEIEWNQQKRKIIADLSIPKTPSTFPNNFRHLCESGVDLICGVTSKPVSG